MLGGEPVEGDQVLLGLLQELGNLGDAGGQALDHRAGPLAGLGGKDLPQGGGDMPRWAGRQCWYMSRTKCTRAIAAFRPSWASDAQRRTPARPRA